MKTIYAVTSGIYSDYSINALFSSKEKAEEYMMTFSSSEYNEIQEFELDPSSVDLVRRGYSVWHVLMLKNGDTEKIERTEEVENAGHGWIWERTKVLSYARKNLHDVLQYSVWAKTEKHAIKIVNEKRIQMIADGKWK